MSRRDNEEEKEEEELPELPDDEETEEDETDDEKTEEDETDDEKTEEDETDEEDKELPPLPEEEEEKKITTMVSKFRVNDSGKRRFPEVGVAWSHKGQRMAIWYEQKIEIWDVGKGEKQTKDLGDYIYNVAWSHEDDRLAVTFVDFGTRVYDSSSLEEKTKLVEFCYDVSWSHDDRFLAGGDSPHYTIADGIAPRDRVIENGIVVRHGLPLSYWFLFDAHTGQEITHTGTEARGLCSFSFNRDSSMLLVSDATEAFIFDVEQKKKHQGLTGFDVKKGKPITSTVSWNCSLGNIVAVGHWNEVSLWKADEQNAWRWFKTIKIEGSIRGLEWSPDGHRLAVSDTAGCFYIYSLRTLKGPLLKRVIKSQFRDRSVDVCTISWNSDGKQVAIGTNTGYFYTFDVVHSEAAVKWALPQNRANNRKDALEMFRKKAEQEEKEQNQRREAKEKKQKKRETGKKRR